MWAVLAYQINACVVVSPFSGEDYTNYTRAVTPTEGIIYEYDLSWESLFLIFVYLHRIPCINDQGRTQGGVGALGA